MWTTFSLMSNLDSWKSTLEFVVCLNFRKYIFVFGVQKLFWPKFFVVVAEINLRPGVHCILVLLYLISAPYRFYPWMSIVKTVLRSALYIPRFHPPSVFGRLYCVGFLAEAKYYSFQLFWKWLDNDIGTVIIYQFWFRK